MVSKLLQEAVEVLTRMTKRPYDPMDRGPPGLQQSHAIVLLQERNELRDLLAHGGPECSDKHDWLNRAEAILEAPTTPNNFEGFEIQEYFIGQRVLIGKEIGVVVPAPAKDPIDFTRMWVMLYSNDYASHYDIKNVRPLPGGQL